MEGECSNWGVVVVEVYIDDSLPALSAPNSYILNDLHGYVFVRIRFEHDVRMSSV